MDSSHDQEFAIPIVVIEEQLRGWLAVIHRSSDSARLIGAYASLNALCSFFAEWEIAQFEEQAMQLFQQLKQAGVRMGTMDMRIASIALALDATLLTANASDFSRVPGLRFESWI